MNDPISVLIADDHPIFRKGLRDIIESSPGLRVVAEAGSGTEAMAMIQSLAPAVAVLDMHMPGMNGVEVARKLQSQNIPTVSVFLTMYKDEETFTAAMDAGVRGYLVKDNALLDIVDCIRAVAAGHPYISPTLSRFLVDRSRPKAASIPGLEQLTPAERRVLQLIAEYKTSKEIASELGIHPRTVDNHRTNASSKLGLQGSHALLRFAAEHKAKLR